MLISEPLPFVKEFIGALNAVLKEHAQGMRGLSLAQRSWLGFCVMAILVTNSVCWARFERAGMGRYSLAALSWMFRHGKIDWEGLLVSSVRVVLRRHGITEGVLSLDDSDKRRSNSTKRIAHVHKLKDKASGGFIMGQCLIFLVLVTPKVTLPVGFAFYRPEPARSAWAKRNKALKAAGVPAKERPPKPPRNDERYPSKGALALGLLKRFREQHPGLRVRCVLADALYGTGRFLNEASALFGGVQVISQLRSNQNSKHPGVQQSVPVRGGETIDVTVGSARLVVCAHGRKRFVIALKYQGEEAYRYLVASDLTWRTLDIVQAYTFRWLIEVFFSDWKAYEGWGALTKQPDELLLHPDQLAQLENKLPAYTVGSLSNRVKVDSLLGVIRELVSSEHPQRELQRLADQLQELFPLNLSAKHMAHRQMGRLEPTPSLKYKAA